MVEVGSGANRQLEDIRLSRYACYLVETAQQLGVETALDFAVFQNHGYQGLYGGLDHMGSTELAANLFRATQTEEKLRRDEVSTKQLANQTHYEVGQKVRQTIKDLGGTMPESLPSPDKSIQQLENTAKSKDAPE